jgi:hypothetical protein
LIFAKGIEVESNRIGSAARIFGRAKTASHPESRLPLTLSRGGDSVGFHQWQDFKAHIQGLWNPDWPTISNGSGLRKRLDIHRVGLIATDAHEIAVLISANHDSNMTSAAPRHGHEGSNRRTSELLAPISKVESPKCFGTFARSFG